jgi:hypothetical protein
MNGPKQNNTQADWGGIGMMAGSMRDTMGQQQQIDEWNQKNSVLDYVFGGVGAALGSYWGPAGSQFGWQLGESISDWYSATNVPDLTTGYDFNLNVGEEAMNYMESAGWMDLFGDWTDDLMGAKNTLFKKGTGIFADPEDQQVTGVGSSLYNIWSGE